MQRVFQERGRAFVWFLVGLVGNGTMVLFWTAALSEHSRNGQLTVSYMQSYYMLLLTAGSLLMSHIETDVAEHDIAQGGLSMYLLKPISYIWIRFADELPWRLLTGAFGAMMCSILAVTLVPLQITHDPLLLFLTMVMAVFALMLSFVMKMILGFTAFWLTNIRGLQDLLEITLLLTAGYVIPIHLYPQTLQQFLVLTPFPYMVYYPVVAIMGSLSINQVLKVLVIQLLWLGVFIGIYRWIFNAGLKKFSGVGQ